MNAAGRLGAFAGALAAIFAAGTAAGSALNPSAPGTSAASSHSAGARGGVHVGEHGAMATAAGDSVRGLAVAQDGLRLVLEATDRPARRSQPVSFQIVDPSGAPVRDFDVAHEKRMHVIVVRRDLTGFQHLHPTLSAGGTWSVPLRLTEPGSYRFFADFTRRGQPVTLATDLRASGNATLRSLPPSSTTTNADGLTVTRPSAVPTTAGHATMLNFAATTGAADPAALQPYLGAGGHLVALREGDLAFLHVHPTDDPAAWQEGRVAFQTTFPTAGRYRLFLQVQVNGTIHTAAFTQEVK